MHCYVVRSYGDFATKYVVMWLHSHFPVGTNSFYQAPHIVPSRRRHHLSSDIYRLPIIPLNFDFDYVLLSVSPSSHIRLLMTFL